MQTTFTVEFAGNVFLETSHMAIAFSHYLQYFVDYMNSLKNEVEAKSSTDLEKVILQSHFLHS